VPLCPPQIPHDLPWVRTRAVAVGSRRLTTWAMTRPWRNVSSNYWTAFVIHLHLILLPWFYFSLKTSCFSSQFLICLIRVTGLTHFTLIMFGYDCKLWKFSLHNLFHPSLTCSLLSISILFRGLFPNALNLCLSVGIEIKNETALADS
jgi:hypothetical protein